jgi:hypothetical protein
MSEAVVEITKVRKHAVKTKAEDLKVGDAVFDVWGRTYALTKVVHFVKTTHVEREDGLTERLTRGEIITVLPKGSW